MGDAVTVVRIYLSEADHGRRKNLMQEILNILHDQHRVRGVTVFRGIAGFGEAGEVHAADILRLMVDLPLVIEFFDEPAVVQAALGLLSGLLPGGRIVQWQATCA
jgi:PII-like signaling protein